MQNAAYASPVGWSGLYFYVGKSGEYSVLDAATGATVLERLLTLAPEKKENGNMYPSLTLADGKLFISDDCGQTLVLEATRAPREISRNRLPAGSGSTRGTCSCRHARCATSSTGSAPRTPRSS